MSTLRKIQIFVGDQTAGTIAETPKREIFFEYDRGWLASGLQWPEFSENAGVSESSNKRVAASLAAAD
jgi:hypothetical protein